ncbi:MAG: thiamine pyrophosphate-binding protein [Negativicutes bacterium]|nr:thiamine pyrophosphate-binding protein [Negativicutes bacterium]
MTTVAQQLIKSLQAIGVKYVFGIPGGPSIPYMEAMRNNGIEFVLTSNEQSAGMMADVCGRLTGVPGVCHATFGPGATNLATGIGGALLDRSPLLAFTTEVKDADVGRRVQMNIDHQALYQPITKWTTRLSKDNFKETMTKAFRVATAEMPGPVHIGLPSNIDGDILDSGSMVDTIAKGSIPLPDASLLEEAAKMIRQAKKPILAIGLTAARLGLHPAIREFVNKNNIPVLLTLMAKGIISDSHPCYAGVIFHAQSDLVSPVYRQADLVIGIGYDSIEFNYESWMPNVPLLHIDTEPADITAEYKDVCAVTGDLAAALAYLNSLTLPAYSWDLEEIKQNKAKLFQALNPRTDGFNPSELIAALQQVLPKDGIITGDVGAHLHLLGQLWKMDEPNRFIMTNGWSTMGFGIPSAIGAKLCRPQSQVVCVTGDGGFLMNCGELMTARRLGINVVVVVLCDRNLSLIEVKQNWKAVVPYGTDLYKGEYFGADQFLGVPIFKANDPGEMKAALQKAFSTQGPAIVEAYVDGAVYQNMITRSYK